MNLSLTRPLPIQAVRTLLLCLAMLLPAQAQEKSPGTPEISGKARRIHRSAILIDGHNDLPWELRKASRGGAELPDLSKPQPQYATDIPRLRQGGMGAQFWAAYIPSDTAKTGDAARQTLEQIDLIHRLIDRYPNTFELALTAEDIERIHRRGKIASLIGIEGGHALENSLSLLRNYHRLGVRYLTLTHADSLDWADAATDTPKSGGLSDFGRQVILEMNRLGMLVDISHVSAATMHAVLDVTRAPIIASHSSAYAIAPHPRNIPDDVLLRLKTNRGLVMVNFFSGFIVPDGAERMAGMFEVSRQLRAQYPVEAEFQQAMAKWRKENPIPPGTVADLVNHIDHIVKIAGIDHVGLGSDYDGVSVLPAGLSDVSCYPAITQELLNRRYSARDIHKILGQNLLRVLREARQISLRWKE